MGRPIGDGRRTGIPARLPHTRMTRVMDTVHGLASRFVFKALDAVLTAHAADGTASSAGHGHASNYRIVHSAARTATRYAPRLMRLVVRSLSRHQVLPFRAPDVPLLSFGTGATVFLLDRISTDAEEPAYVLKVTRRSLGLGLHALESQAQEFRTRYQMVVRWYESSRIIVPLQFVILRGPLLGLSAVACLQPLVSGEKWDFFEYGTDDELLALLRRNPELREQFSRFAACTKAMVAETSRCVDFVGRDNLLLVRAAGCLRLQLIDYGVLDLRHVAVHSPPLHARVKERLARVHRLHQALIDDMSAGGRAQHIALEA